MGIKQFMISFILATILLSTLFVSFQFVGSIAGFRPLVKNHYDDIAKSSSRPRKPPYPVSFAYLISASKGDAQKLKRTVRALYHPANYYLLHMDYDAPAWEHREVERFVSGEVVFREMGNVWVVGKPNLVTYRGPTMLATTLHAMAMLLRSCQWDWFINLSASDYPLVTQDDLIHAFSGLPRNLNFIQHSSHLGWKLNKRGKPIIIDPALYSHNKSEIWWAIKQRSLPTSFKLYTAWTILSRSFAEYSIVGWDNLPRTLLLYYTNFVSSPEGYFQTLICNSEYRNSTVNHDLHYITWDNPPKQHPRSLGLKDFRRMVLSNRPFARKFRKNDPVLDKIDRDLLKRRRGKFTRGGWCDRQHVKPPETCSSLHAEKNVVLRPGSGSRRLRILFSKILSARNFNKRQCR
ncbi:beta-glucuronosyltransferase GlcAT14A isoform X2 [Malania oleifera]|uniref:beta-glucuronosyltransferase GlcAT14A isoform X2 n=1 Tax=Malania oleifera TaxID=397392 RepID=UPI0025AE22C1|nr:beta-glucuronosyltransferase GlcAT14A isoform X2 [Malania oleifera]